MEQELVRVPELCDPDKCSATSPRTAPGALAQWERWAQVRSLAEITSTLDEHDALDGLPFMPEMAAHCGGTFRVIRRIVKTCVEGTGMRALRNQDVVLLEGLRCSGAAHGGCDKGCTLFWKEAWLRSVPSRLGGESALSKPSGGRILRTTTEPRKWYCQSTELRGATVALSFVAKFLMCLRDLRQSSYTAGEFLVTGMKWARLRATGFAARRHVLRGIQVRTPKASLGLQEGEEVVVRSRAEISATLDKQGRNRGLEFSSEMIAFCDRRYRVIKRVKRIIVESTGEMRDLEDTVVLEHVVCNMQVLGGCPRNQYYLWREIWLKRARPG